jgi:hypothetical protein
MMAEKAIMMVMNVRAARASCLSEQVGVRKNITVEDFGIFQSINGLLTRHPIARKVTKRNGSLRYLHLCTIVSVYENQFEISRGKSAAVNIEAAHTPGLRYPEEVGARVFREPDVLI